MIGTIVVMDKKAYQDWLNSTQAEGSMALEGRKLFLKLQCITCHSRDAQARGPLLEGIAGKTIQLKDGGSTIANKNYLRESILRPDAKIVAGYQNIMPVYTLKTPQNEEGRLDEEDLARLIAFIESLGPGQTPDRVEQSAPPVAEPREGEAPAEPQQKKKP